MPMLVGLLGAYSNHDIHPVPIPKPAPVGFSANVIINGKPAHHVGNTFIEHTIPMLPPPPLHADVPLVTLKWGDGQKWQGTPNLKLKRGDTSYKAIMTFDVCKKEVNA